MKLDVTHLRSARRVVLIEVVAAEGQGTNDDPVRLVTYYFTEDGEPVINSDRSRIPRPWGIHSHGFQFIDPRPRDV